tara:strand:- start:79 stop:663 length:585 start_codon:yes stop_codon:yes gene_type:complete
MGALHGDDESRNMRLNLQCHPLTPALAVDQIIVEWSLSDSGTIWLRYHVDGTVAEVQLPDHADPSQRMDGLWQHSCFELFLKKPGSKHYCEFNFSPSGHWAAYSFSDYRQGMEQLRMAQRPEILMDFSDTHIGLEATVQLPGILQGSALDAGLSAVIEMHNGEKSLWALAHPAGKPDFHHQDCFKLKIEAAERS